MKKFELPEIKIDWFTLERDELASSHANDPTDPSYTGENLQPYESEQPESDAFVKQ